MKSCLCIAVMYFLLSIICSTCGALDITDVRSDTISINVTNAVIKEQYNITNGSTKVLVENVEYYAFFVIQIHSYEHKVALSNETTFNLHNSINGTNIGLVKIIRSSDAMKPIPFYIHAEENGTILLAVTAYSYEDPIPGGCSMTFNTNISPYLNVTYDTALIEVNYQDMSSFKHFCEESVGRLEIYRLFLDRSTEFTAEGYFNGIKSMLTVNDIRRNGENITASGGKTSAFRKFISGYMGLGQVFAVVAVVGNRSSAYVPAVTYSCDITNGADSCYDYNWVCWAIFSCLILFIGIVMFFAEANTSSVHVHLFSLCSSIYCLYLLLFTTNSSSWVMAAGFIGYGLAYIFFAVVDACSDSHRHQYFQGFFIGMSCGLCLAAVVVTSPLISITDPTIYLGIFIGLSITFGFLLLMLNFFGNHFAYNFLAVFLVMMSISYLSGGTMHYVVAEVIRYLSVKNYNLAVKFDLYSVTQAVVLVLISSVKSFVGVKTEEGRYSVYLKIVKVTNNHYNYIQFE